MLEDGLRNEGSWDRGLFSADDEPRTPGGGLLLTGRWCPGTGDGLKLFDPWGAGSSWLNAVPSLAPAGNGLRPIYLWIFNLSLDFAHTSVNSWLSAEKQNKLTNKFKFLIVKLWKKNTKQIRMEKETQANKQRKKTRLIKVRYFSYDKKRREIF